MKKTLQSTLICLTLASGIGFVPALLPSPAYAVDNMESTDAPDLTSVRAKIKAGDYAGALAELRDIAEDTQQADVYNLLGYTLRKTGDFKTSLAYYTKALELQPDHKAAREYLGELFVETGNLDKAKEQLAALQRLCPDGCEEREDLQKAIDAKTAQE
jgi:Flp pilus assembly protein TadD